jgi:hypothetical protein
LRVGCARRKLDSVSEKGCKTSLGIVADLRIRTRFWIRDLFKSFILMFCHCGSRFWEFWANHLKPRLQLNHVPIPVHETHSAKVIQITTTSTSKTPSLTRRTPAGGVLHTSIFEVAYFA